MPKVVDHEERRAAIAIGVIEVMADGGIGKVSLRSVAHATGVSMGSVQHYFATKADLVRHACQMFIDRATAQHADTEGSAGTERIWALLTMNIPDTAEQRTGTAIWQEFVIAAVTDPSISELITRAWQQRRRTLIELLDRDEITSGKASGEVADLLAAASDGLALQAVLGALTHEEACDRMRVQFTTLGLTG